MNSSTSCDSVWRKRLNELRSVWPDFVSGRNTGLHKTRVASRRIREALPVVSVCAPQSKVKKLNKKMRALTRYLGPIRELDVELDILDDASKTNGVPGRVIEMVRREIAAKRQALRHELAENAPVGDVKKLIRQLERVSKREEGKRKKDSEYEARWRSALAARMLRRAKSLADAVDQAGPLYAPERIHAVRVSTKKLRYAIEIAKDAGVPGAAVLIRTLKKQQDRLGRLHDLQALLKHVREADTSPSIGARVNDLTAYADSLERDCRRLHAAFVERREELTDCVKQVRQQLVPALTTPARRQARVASRTAHTSLTVRARSS
jgi:CHAD domain-containing protein